MDHVAILTRKYKYIEKILNKEKTVESRWYVNKIVPWDRIKKGDTVYLKNTGEPVTAKAIVSKVLFFKDLSKEKILEIYESYGREIIPEAAESDFALYAQEKYSKKKKYCILIFLNNPERIKPFNINKTGFGNACAWMIVKDIDKIKHY